MMVTQFPTEPDQQERIRKLRAELDKIGGSIIGRHEQMPADVEEEFCGTYSNMKPKSRLAF